MDGGMGMHSHPDYCNSLVSGWFMCWGKVPEEKSQGALGLPDQIPGIAWRWLASSCDVY